MAVVVGVVRVKPGVSFARIAPAGFRLLSALERTARRLRRDLTITCGCEGHPAADPHTLGEAFDVGSHDVRREDQALVLRTVMLELADAGEPLLAASDGLVTQHFFGWVEHRGDPDEHFHFQRRRATVYATAKETAP